MEGTSKSETRLHNISRMALIFSALVWGTAFGFVYALDHQDQLWLKVALFSLFAFSFYGAFLATRKTRILLAQLVF